MSPQRIQRTRTKGWRLPDGAVYVGRGRGESGKWGNPFRLFGHSWGHHLAAVALFRGYLDRRAHGRPHDLADYPSDEDIRRELAGKDLACWCPPGMPCHADVLLDIANTADHDDQEATRR